MSPVGSGSRCNLATTARSTQGGHVFRPPRGEEQKSQLTLPADDLAQNFLGRAVDPVQILDHHHDQGKAAAHLQQLPQKFARAQADQ
jgi:hypothetical protein